MNKAKSSWFADREIPSQSSRRSWQGELPVILVSNVRPKRVRRFAGESTVTQMPHRLEPPQLLNGRVKPGRRPGVCIVYIHRWMAAFSALLQPRKARADFLLAGRSAQISVVATGIITRSEQRRRSHDGLAVDMARACVESEEECNWRFN
jgi:hypothetical protein